LHEIGNETGEKGMSIFDHSRGEKICDRHCVENQPHNHSVYQIFQFSTVGLIFSSFFYVNFLCHNLDRWISDISTEDKRALLKNKRLDVNVILIEPSILIELSHLLSFIVLLAYYFNGLKFNINIVEFSDGIIT